MSASKKLSTSVKALCYLAQTHPRPQNSREIADKIGVNASKLRHLLSLLSKNGIVESTQGPAGGFKLKKDPSKIHLQEVYCAVEYRKAFHLDIGNFDADWYREAFNTYFWDLFADIQADIEARMEKISLSYILKKLNIESNFIIKGN